MLSYTFSSTALCLLSLVSPLSMQVLVCLDHRGQVSEGIFFFPFADLEDIMAYLHLQTQTQVLLRLLAICQDLCNYQRLSPRSRSHILSTTFAQIYLTGFWNGFRSKTTLGFHRGRKRSGGKMLPGLQNRQNIPLSCVSCVPPHRNQIKSRL